MPSFLGLPFAVGGAACAVPFGGRPRSHGSTRGFSQSCYICRSARDSGFSEGHEMIRLRLFHPGRRVYRLSRRGDDVLEERWVAFRRVPPHWEKIFSSTLDLIWLSHTHQPG